MEELNRTSVTAGIEIFTAKKLLQVLVNINLISDCLQNQFVQNDRFLQKLQVVLIFFLLKP